MEILKTFLDIFLHIDKNLAVVIANFGGWSYVILWLVIFMETGLVVTPFLPGDSLLFAAGALAAMGSFNIWLLSGLLLLAAFVGDTVNYWIGHTVGSKAFDPNFKLRIINYELKTGKILKPEYLHKAQSFYEKHGGKAILLSRFVPIVRTFAPFVAGVGKMNYGKFVFYNAFGGLLWVAIFTFGGFFFGNIPIVRENFHYVVVAIILISVVPIGVEWWKGRKR